MKLKITILLIICLTASLASAITGGGRMSGVFASYKVPTAPNAPTGVTATAGYLQNTVNWTAPTVDSSHDAATSYTLYGGTTASPTTSIYSGSATTYTHTSLTAGTPYYYRVKATNATGTSAYSSPDATATPTSGDSDFAAYTNDSPATITVDGTVHTVGATSMKFVEDTTTGNNQMWRPITMPSTGTVVFTRWVYIQSKFSAGVTEFHIASMGNGTTGSNLTAWRAQVGYHHDSGNAAQSGFGLDRNTGGWVQVYPESSIQLNHWYKIVAEYNCTSNQTRATVYDTDGTTQLAQSAWAAPGGSTFAGTTGAFFLGRSGQAATVNVDGLTDGI